MLSRCQTPGTGKTVVHLYPAIFALQTINVTVNANSRENWKYFLLRMASCSDNIIRSHVSPSWWCLIWISTKAGLSKDKLVWFSLRSYNVHHPSYAELTLIYGFNQISFNSYSSHNSLLVFSPLLIKIMFFQTWQF